ncbi:MAG: flagellar hook-length control protein FliK [Desulfovibrionaceae bacterium]|nr:flagellar hook-length control protein FliK [Desulfovibrionaceae bacterium]
MQIIPLDAVQSESGTTTLSINTYSSYSESVGFSVPLKEKNAHLIAQEGESVVPTTRLSFEEILRLKNTIQEKKKQNQGEEEALISLLEQGGSHTIESIIEQMVDGIRGLQALTPEEYVSLQNFLQDIGCSFEDIEKITDQMMTQSGVMQGVETIISRTKEYLENNPHIEGIYDITPILRKISMGQYETPSYEGEISGNQLISKLENILEEIQDIAEQRELQIENLSAQLAEDIQEIVRRREEKAQSSANASTQGNSVVSAEEFKFTRSATEDGLSTLVTKDDKEESSHSQYSEDGLPQERNEQGYNDTIFTEQNNTTLFGKQVTIEYQNTSLFQKSLLGNHAILESHKNYILDTVQQSFISLKNTNSAEIILQLTPQELGNIELQLQYSDGRIQAVLRPDQRDVYHLLKEQSPHIMHSLQEQGVNIDAVTVVENTGEWLQYQSSREQFSHNSHENLQEQVLSQEHERKGRIRYLLGQLTKDSIKSVQNSTRLLEVVA